MVRFPGWLAEVGRPARGPVPWAGMGVGALAVGVPLVAGLSAGQLIMAVLMAFGGLLGAMADRPGPYPRRMGRVSIAGVLGGVGLLVGAVGGATGGWRSWFWSWWPGCPRC
jgi:hypothetical protein